MTESLLKKYDIPINHLDFDYIKKCENVKEIERIVTILKSGEEGYYPDLVNCALTKLRSLNPNSKILREEVPVLNKRSMNNEEWNDISSNIYGWTDKMKKQTEVLRKGEPFIGHSNACPIRQFSQKDTNEDETKESYIKRIKSCDYAQWDKYNPEVEMLKMDLNEERLCETVKIKNRRNVTTIDQSKTKELVEKLSSVEKKDLANKHRIKGNEFYKVGDFDEAIQEYTISIELFPTASAFNNRAITYLKMNNLEMTIADCEKCLRLEPNNIKALFRKAQALLKQLKYREAYDECTKILSVESNNEWAIQKITEIKSKITQLPPANAFRMEIVENEPDIENKVSMESDDDFANLIIPKKIIPSKLSKFKSNFVLNDNLSDKKKQESNQKLNECTGDTDFIAPFLNTQPKSQVRPKITEYCNGVIIEEL